MTQGERIKQVRLSFGLSQDKFAARIKIKGPSISMIESGKTNAGDQTISLICREFGVSETWLRTGEGPMQTSREKEISAFLGDILTDDSNFRRALIHLMAKMTPEEWAKVEAKARELLAEMETPPPG